MHTPAKPFCRVLSYAAIHILVKAEIVSDCYKSVVVKILFTRYYKTAVATTDRKATSSSKNPIYTKHCGQLCTQKLLLLHMQSIDASSADKSYWVIYIYFRKLYDLMLLYGAKVTTFIEWNLIWAAGTLTVKFC